MTNFEISVFRNMANGSSMADKIYLYKVRQFSSMVLWLLVKILDRSSLLMFQGRPTELDGIIQDKLREAVKSATKTEELISWCCNAAELENQEDGS